MGGKADLQEPQRPVLARNLAGTRFCFPQWLQARRTGKRNLHNRQFGLGANDRMPRTIPKFPWN